MNKIFFTPPTNANPTTIKKYLKYCNNPFNSISEMNETIIKRWNKTVGKSDKSYVMGDFATNKNNLTSTKQDAIVVDIEAKRRRQ